MNGKIFTILCILVSLVVIVSCQTEQTDRNQDVSIADPIKIMDPQQVYLADLWNANKSIVWEVAHTDSFDWKCNHHSEPSVPESWYNAGFTQHTFSFDYVGYSFEPVEDHWIHLTIKVPKIYAFDDIMPGDQQVMPIKVETDFGGDLTAPLTLTFAFHPGLRPNCGNYCIFGLSQVQENPPWYEMTYPQWICPDNQVPPPAKTIAEPPRHIIEDPIFVDPIIACATGLQVEIYNFGATKPDRWEVANGCCGGKSVTPCDW